jgi:hypothetical protein
MTTPHSDDRLDTLLEELGPADPPAGFSTRVMAAITRTTAHRTPVRPAAKIIPFSSGGIAMIVTRKAMWGIAAAAAIVLAVFVTRGFPPVGRGTEGAIGAAKKYQTPQIADKDVIVGDTATQEFLQSEAFDRLIKDPLAASLLKDAQIRAALRQDGFASALRDANVRVALQNGMLARIFGDAAARAALQDALRSNFSDAALHQIAADAALKDAAQASLSRTAELRNARAELASALSDAALRDALRNDAFRSMLDNAAFRQSLSRAEMSAALNNAAFVAALNRSGFSAALNSAQLDAALASR